MSTLKCLTLRLRSLSLSIGMRLVVLCCLWCFMIFFRQPLRVSSWKCRPTRMPGRRVKDNNQHTHTAKTHNTPTRQQHTTHPHDSESKAANCGLLISCGYLICELIAVFLSNFSFSNGPDARNYSFDRIVRTTNNFHTTQDEDTACKQHPSPNLTVIVIKLSS